jgi:hypothetical protein
MHEFVGNTDNEWSKESKTNNSVKRDKDMRI